MSKLLTTKDIAKMLGISLPTVYRLIDSKKINYYKIGNSVRVKEENWKIILENIKLIY